MTKGEAAVNLRLVTLPVEFDCSSSKIRSG